MKVIFKHMVSGFIGNADDMIYYYDPRLGRVLARRKPRVKATARNYAFGNTIKNIMSIHPSPAYKDDLMSYAERCYNTPLFKGVRPLWNNLYMKIMFAMQKDYPGMDLNTLSRADIIDLALPCRTVSNAVAAGYLPEVRNWQELTAAL